MNTKCIFTPFVARNLLKMGNPIVDIKPDKNNKDKTIFVFEDTNKLNEIENKINSLIELLNESVAQLKEATKEK